MSQLLPDPSFLRGSALDKKARAMTVEEIEAELDAAKQVSKNARKQKLAGVPGILDNLLIDDSAWDVTIEALSKAGVNNIDDLMLTARRLYLGYADTEKKLTDALLDGLIIDKLRAFGARASVEKSTTSVKAPATTTAAATTTTLDGTATPAGTTPSHSPPPRMTHAH